MSEWPEARLTDVAPAAGPTSVTMADGWHWNWDGTDGGRWEAEWIDDHGKWHIWENGGLYGLEEEDYAVVGWEELLTVVALGLGTLGKGV